jgi:hypothetical protein
MTNKRHAWCDTALAQLWQHRVLPFYGTGADLRKGRQVAELPCVGLDIAGKPGGKLGSGDPACVPFCLEDVTGSGLRGIGVVLPIHQAEDQDADRQHQPDGGQNDRRDCHAMSGGGA